MKNAYLLITFCFISITTSFATPNNTPFIFIENGIEYAVFKNGDFDFNNIQSNSTGVHINTSYINLSFNSGRNYAPNVYTNQYGVITRINNTNILYDYNGRVQRIGSILLKYNNYGYVHTIGNLNIRYSGQNHYCTGNINRINTNYNPIYKNYRSSKRFQIAKINNKYQAKKRAQYKTSKKHYSNKYKTVSNVKNINKKYVKPTYQTKKNKSYAYNTKKNSYRR